MLSARYSALPAQNKSELCIFCLECVGEHFLVCHFYTGCIVECRACEACAEANVLTDEIVNAMLTQLLTKQRERSVGSLCWEEDCREPALFGAPNDLCATACGEHAREGHAYIKRMTCSHGERLLFAPKDSLFPVRGICCARPTDIDVTRLTDTILEGLHVLRTVGNWQRVGQEWFTFVLYDVDRRSIGDYKLCLVQLGTGRLRGARLRIGRTDAGKLKRAVVANIYNKLHDLDVLACVDKLPQVVMHATVTKGPECIFYMETLSSNPTVMQQSPRSLVDFF